MGLSLFAGEAEGRLDAVLQERYAGALAPLYNYMNESAVDRRRADPDPQGRARAAHAGRH